MKKLLLATMIAFFMMFSYANACDGPECENETSADASGWVGTPEWDRGNDGEDWYYNSGYSEHKYDVEAQGTKFAYANGNGESLMYGLGGSFQREVREGELSGSGALTISKSKADGYGIGIDSADCNTGADKVKIDLEIRGVAYQANGAYSDDKSNEIGGWNESSVEYWGQTDKTDYGSDDRYVYLYTKKRNNWFPGAHWVNPPGPNNAYWAKDIYITIPDLIAEESDRIGGMGITGGGTLVYARQLQDESVVAGITGNFATGCLYGAEHKSINVEGQGGIGGVANLPGSGYATFNATFNYAGQNFGAGIAGGQAKVVRTYSDNGVKVTSTASAFSGVKTGGNYGRPQ